METDVASRKIFIGGLSYGTDDDKLKSYFEQFGAVQDAVVMKDPVTRRSRGFGFITYTHTSYVDQALAIGIHVIDSRKVEAKRAVPRHEVAREALSSKTANVPHMNHINGNFHPGNPHSHFHNEVPHINSDEYAYCKIFVGGLHYDTRDGEFRNYFEKYGKVISAEVMFNRETHKSRGFGFIIFDNEASVDQVCEEREHTIDGKTVEVKRAVPRSKIGLLGTNPPPEAHTTPPNAHAHAAPASNHKTGKVSNPIPLTSPTIPTPVTPKSQGKNSQLNTPNTQSVPKTTPETPPTSYAAAVISGPGGQPNHKPTSQQNSPHLQTISASPSLGPIGSPTNSSAGNVNISFGMMLPPVSSNSTFGGGGGGGGGGSNSLNSAHGHGTSSQFYPPPQSSQSLFQQQQQQHSSGLDPSSSSHHTTSSHRKKLTTHLLQHQEQFPPPTSSPMRSVTTNYPLLDDQHPPPHLQYPSPNSFHYSRGRAYTESFLFSMPSSQKGSSLTFPLQHLTFSPSPDLPYPPLLPSNLDSNLDEESLQHETNPSAPPPVPPAVVTSVPPDDILSQSSWSPSNKKSGSGNRESQLENLFISNRQDMERSVSLGGLGWMPSSLSSESTHPPESRRGVSDLGIGVGFGSSGLGHHPHPHDGRGFSPPHANLQPPPFVPSMSAWESFVDHSVNNSNQTSPQHPSPLSQQHQHHHQQQQLQQLEYQQYHQHSPHQHLTSPMRPHSYSLNHLYDGLSPNSRLHPPSPLGHSSIHSPGSNSVFSHQQEGGHDDGDDDDNSYHAIQELRLQAPEYNPNNPSSASNWR